MSSSPNNDNNDIQKSKFSSESSLETEERILKSMGRALLRKISRIQYRGPLLLEPAERRTVDEFNTNSLKTLAAGGATLIMRRLTRGILRRKVGRRTPTNVPPSFLDRNEDLLHPSSRPTSSLIFGILGWTLDWTLTLTVSFATMVYVFDIDTTFDKLTRIPLTPGRSVLSRDFCPPLVEEWERLHKDPTIDPEVWKTPPTQSLLKILQLHQLVQNCQRRRQYQKQLSRINNSTMSPSDTQSLDDISIPEPGVPDTIQFDEVVELYDPSTQAAPTEKQWVDNLVTDQEDSSSSRRGK
jgi:hypothetical protein